MEEIQGLDRVREEVADLEARATGMPAIETQERYELAAELRSEAKERMKKVVETLADAKKKTYDAWKATTALESRLLEPLEAVVKALDQGMKGFLAAQERKRQEAERVAWEAQEAARRAAIVAEASEAPEAEKLAAQLERKADRAAVKAESFEAPKAAGTSSRKTYKAEIFDPDLVPREYCIPDEAKIKALAKAMGAKLSIPGVRVVEDFVISSRT